MYSLKSAINTLNLSTFGRKLTELLAFKSPHHHHPPDYDYYGASAVDCGSTVIAVFWGMMVMGLKC